MYTKPVKWRRWAGTRGSITRAIEAAVVEVERWCGYSSTCTVRLVYSDGLVQREEEPGILAGLTTRDLESIREVHFEIEPSRDEWFRLREEARDAWLGTPADERPAAPVPPPPDPTQMRVQLDADWDSIVAMRVTVQGPERTRVEGLAGLMERQVLQGGSGLLRNYPAAAVRWTLPFMFATVGAFIAAIAFGGRGPGLQWQEAVALVLGLGLGALVGVCLLYLVPPLELLEDGSPSRLSRWGKWLVGTIVVGLVLGVAGNWLSGGF